MFSSRRVLDSGSPADPALDYVLTEVVHCKSRDEIGVRESLNTCTAMHLDHILAAAAAPVVVILGGKAMARVRTVWDLPKDFHSTERRPYAQ